jgi:hypothetical protein
MAGCVVTGTVRKAPPAQARWILSNRPFPCAKSENGVRAIDHLKSVGHSEIGGSVSRASSVTSPLFGHLPTQHPPYQSRRRWRLHRFTPFLTEGGATEVYSISGRGRHNGGLLHLRLREARRRSTPSPDEGGAAEVYSIFGRGRRDGGLLQVRACLPNPRRRSQMPQVHHHALRLIVALSVDLADPHYRSISLGRPDELDPPGSDTSPTYL